MSRRDELDKRYQPASPDDLAAHPPANQVCADVRGLLRDYVDGELRDREQTEVEDHVHECRVCGLALSRAESERMLIETSLEDVLRESPPLSFTADVMRQVHEEVATPPPTGFTRRVMERVVEDIEEGVEPATWRRRPVLLTVVMLAATLVLAAVLSFALFDVAAEPGVAIVRAEGATFVRDGVATALFVDDRFPDRGRRGSDRFVTGPEGVLDLQLEPDIRVQAGADSSLRIDVTAAEAAARELELETGEFTLQTDADLEMRFADGSSLQVGPGQYEVSVEPVRHQDQREGVRVEVRVDEGEASILRGSQRNVVTRGQLGRYSSFSTIYIDVSTGDELLHASRRRGNRRDRGAPRRTQPLEPAFGVVLDPRTNTPIADCTVTVRHYLGHETVQTDAAGEFRVSGLLELDGQFLMVRAVPPATQVHRGLAAMGFTPTRVDSRQVNTRRFFLARGGTLAGRLLDVQGRAIENTWVQLCQIDEALGTAQPVSGAVRIEDSGRFELRGVPVGSRLNQSLVLLAQAPGRSPELVWTGTHVRAEDTALRLSFRVRAPKRIAGLPAWASMQLLVPIGGVPVSSGFAVRTVQADGEGRLQQELPRDFFVLTGLGAPRSARIGAGGKLSFDRRTVPTVLRALRAGDLPENGLHWFASAREFEVAFVPASGGGISVQDGTTGQACPGTRIFRRAPDGVLWFHGLFDGRELLRFAEDATGRLLGQTPEGQVGEFDLGDGLRRARRVMSVYQPARIEWQGVTTGWIELSFSTKAAGDFPIVRRVAESPWLMRSGSYRFRGRPLRLEPGSTTTLR